MCISHIFYRYLLDYYVLKMRTQAYENILKGHVTIPVSYVQKELAFNSERECTTFLKDQKSRIDNVLNDDNKIETIIDCKATLSLATPILSSALISSSHKNKNNHASSEISIKKGSNKAEKIKMKIGNNMKIQLEKSVFSMKNGIKKNIGGNSVDYGGSGQNGGNDGSLGFSSSSSKNRNIKADDSGSSIVSSNSSSSNGFTSKSHTKINITHNGNKINSSHNTVFSSLNPTNIKTNSLPKDNDIGIKKIKIDRGPIINANINHDNNGDGHNRKRKKGGNGSDNNNKKSKKNRSRG